MSTLFYLFKQSFMRELLVQTRQLKYLINSCLFFLMLLFLFPLTMKPDPLLLKSILGGIIWIGLFLSLLLGAERLFQHDYDQGVLEQWLVSGQSLSLMIAAKIIAHWLFNIFPLLFLCPLVALIFSLNAWQLFALLVSILFGTPALLFLCALGSSLGVGINQKGSLLALILLPLTLPILIFGSATLSNALLGLPVYGNFALLLAFSILCVGFLPFAIAGILRINHAS